MPHSLTDLIVSLAESGDIILWPCTAGVFIRYHDELQRIGLIYSWTDSIGYWEVGSFMTRVGTGEVCPFE